MKSRVVTFALVVAATGLSATGCLESRQLERVTKAQAASLDRLLWPTDYCRAFEWYDDGACDSFCPEPDGDCLAILNACGSWSGWQCADGEFCDRLSCGKASFGYCIDPAGTSPDDSIPVCGCDGHTYASDRERQLAGVARSHMGRCQASIPECGPAHAIGCTGNQVCDIHSCSNIAGGECVELPPACNQQFQPVCGCDGITYHNDCERLQAGVARDHDGECRDPSYPCGPWSGDACPGDLICDVRSCDPNAAGVCVADTAPRSGSSDLDSAVCGCDGNTYASDGERIRAGAALNHPGECQPPVRSCGPWEGGECDQGMVCNILSCDEGTGGECVRQPDICPMVYDPVCGCDGVTYGNDCARLMEAVPLRHEGPCEE